VFGSHDSGSKAPPDDRLSGRLTTQGVDWAITTAAQWTKRHAKFLHTTKITNTGVWICKTDAVVTSKDVDRPCAVMIFSRLPNTALS